ncbi:MAG: hypothetical protein ACI9FB_002075 [Candidatus Azotimanducaceae bacterium]|jgi:hypothetical protein
MARRPFLIKGILGCNRQKIPPEGGNSWRRVFSMSHMATRAMKKAVTTMLPETASIMLKVVRVAYSE